MAEAVAGEGIDRGRALHRPGQSDRERQGLAVVDQARLDELNLLDEAVTLATLPPFARVRAAPDGGDGQDHSLRRAAHGAGAGRSPWRKADRPLLSVAPFEARSVGLIQTRLPGTQGEGSRQDPRR